jgi:hypothetical protein
MKMDLHLHIPGGRAETVPVSLSQEEEEEEEELLGRFWQYSRDLLESKWIRSGMHVRSTLTVRAGEGIKMEAEQPPWESVIEFLHRFRPFGLQKEPTSFGTIKNLVCKLVPHEQVRALAQAQQESFSGRAMQKLVRIESNGVVLNGEETLNNWLNAYEYHRDQTKKKLLDELHQILPLEASIPLFLNLLVDRARAVLNLADLVGLILGKEEEIEVQPDLPSGEDAR